MPNYIQLTNQATNELEDFVSIDEKLCAALQVPCDATLYHCGWYDVIGYSCKDSIQEIIERVQDISPDDKEILTILTWLNENYVLSAWYSH